MFCHQLTHFDYGFVNKEGRLLVGEWIACVMGKKKCPLVNLFCFC